MMTSEFLICLLSGLDGYAKEADAAAVDMQPYLKPSCVMYHHL